MKRLNVILGKKQLVAAGLTVLLGTAVAVNFIYSGGKDKKLTEPAAEAAEEFLTGRLPEEIRVTSVIRE